MTNDLMRREEKFKKPSLTKKLGLPVIDGQEITRSPLREQTWFLSLLISCSVENLALGRIVS